MKPGKNLQTYIETSRQQHSGSIYMPYLTCGDPDFEATIEIASSMIENGASIIELGVPFSDPTADGPTIQRAMVRATSNGQFSMQKVFETAKAIHSKHPNVPIIFLTYFNTLLCFSAPSFEQKIISYLKTASESGVRGLVIPDLPFDSPESMCIRELAIEQNIDISQIMMVTPNTSKERLKQISRHAAGFVYYVTSLGVTGQSGSLPEDLNRRIERVKKSVGVPVLAGFGITKPEEAQMLSGLVDGVIVGSLHHSLIEKGATASEIGKLTGEFVVALKKEKNL